MKTLIRSLVCAFATLCAFQLSAASIGTAAEFVAAMNNDPAGSYTLTADIDLADSGYATIATFSGTLDGAGHKLSGIGAQPLFTSCSGTLKNLKVDGSGATIWGTQTALVCTESRGATFQDVSVGNVTIKVNDTNKGTGIGLFVGMAYDGTSFTRCETLATATVSGNGKANDNVGGFVGKVLNSTVLTGDVASFTDCTNNAAVVATSGDNNASQGTGGFVGKIEFAGTAASDVPVVRFLRCQNHTDIAVAYKSAVGGFVGRCLRTSGSGYGQLLFTECLNDGDIACSQAITASGNYGFGGFLGMFGTGNRPETELSISRSVNRGNISAGDAIDAGGFVGKSQPNLGRVTFMVTDCANYGEIHGYNAGGFIGCYSGNQYNTNGFTIKNCANYGSISAAASGLSGELFGSAGNIHGFALLDNVFAKTASWGSYTVPSGKTAPSMQNVISAADVGYTAATACTALSARAKELGLDEWWKPGKVSGMPELLIWSGDVWKIWTVRYLDDDGETVLHEQQVEDGMAAPSVSEPSRPGCVFDGWKPAVPAVITADFETQATYRQAGTGEIGSAADFVRELTANPAGTFTIKNDIDLTGAGYATIAEFSGTLDGGGKTITGLGSTMLFTMLSGTVRNLTIDGRVAAVPTTVSVAKDTSWAVLSATAVAATVEDVTIKGYDVTYAGVRPTGMGLFFAVATTTAGKGCSFTRCRADASCSIRACSNMNIGGIVGRVNRDSAFYGDCAVFTACTNAATISTAGSGNAAQGTGGICGLIDANADEQDGVIPSVCFINCVNVGALSLTGLYDSFGGIVGQVKGGKGSNKKHPYTGASIVSLVGCENHGSIVCNAQSSSQPWSDSFYAGGMVGSILEKGSAVLSNCVNRADVLLANDFLVTNIVCGGIVGMMDVGGLPVEIVNSANYGAVKAHYCGGLTGKVAGNPGWNVGNVFWYNSANYGSLLKINETSDFDHFGQVVGLVSSGTEKTTNHFVANNCFGQDAVACAAYSVFSLQNYRSTKEAGYDPYRVTKALNTVALANGWTEWKTGKWDDGTCTPELLPFCTRISTRGLVITICGAPSASPTPPLETPDEPDDPVPADPPVVANQLLNLAPAPSGGRFATPTDRVWPSEAGAADICLWHDDRFAACAITIDDNCRPDHDWWQALADEFDIRFTWFVITDNVDAQGTREGTFQGNWAEWQLMADRGHSIQSHTTNHKSDSDTVTLTEAELRAMYKNSIDDINAHITNNVACCIAYPSGDAHEDIAKDYAIAARGVYGVPSAANAINYICTNKGGSNKGTVEMVAFGETTEDPKWIQGKKELARGLNIVLYHYVHAGATDEQREQNAATAEAEVRYIASLKDDRLWVCRFDDVMKYGQERDSATLTVTENTSDRIAFTLTDLMKDELFDFPLTVKVRLSDAWTGVTATQGGKSIPVRIVSHENANYALVKAVPDRGTVVLTK